MARRKKGTEAPITAAPFKTVELSAVPSRRPGEYPPELERAFEFAQTLKKRAVIAFEGPIKEAISFREQGRRLLKQTKRAAFYSIARRGGQVFIWRATEPA